MKHFFARTVFGTLAGLTAFTAHAATLDIVWQNPQEYADIQSADFNQDRYTQRVAEYLTDQFRNDANRMLPADYHLEISVVDVDLAGNVQYYFHTRPSMQQMRVISDLYFPRLEFDYTLRNAEGMIVKSDHVNAEDRRFYYMEEYMRNDPLYFEKRLIDNWFSRTFRGQFTDNSS